jgi:protein required for attachment to host cells
MRLAKGTWVLVLDGEKFLLLRNRGRPDSLELHVIDHAEVANPPTREQGTDQPGRFSDPGAGRSAVEQTDWHALEKVRFARDIAERLRGWALERRFDALVVVADPSTLGALRPHYHPSVAERIIAEIDKDLTRLPVEEIEKVLAAS